MGVFDFFKREKRDAPISGFDKLAMLWEMGTKTKSGVRINETNAMQISSVHACIKVLSESVASLPLHLYKRLPNGKTIDSSSNLYYILHTQANKDTTAYTFWETITYHICAWGNGYAYIERDNFGKVVGLWNLFPDQIEPYRNLDKKLKYRVTINGEMFDLDPIDVLHVVGFGFDGLKGKSPIKLAREAIGIAAATEEFGAKFFENGTHLGGIIEHPSKLSDASYARLKTDFKNAHDGLTNAHKVRILEEGMKYQRLGIPPEDAQFIETRKFQTEEIARIYRVPLHMIGDLSRSTNNNIEHQGLEFTKYTLAPYLKRIEQSIIQRILVTDEEKKNYFAEFDTNGFLRGDIMSRFDAYSKLRNIGVINANEIRAMENLNPIEGGDIYIIQTSYTTDKKIENPIATPNIPIK